MGSHAEESEAEQDARYIAFFNRPDIDGWEIRKGMSDLAALDLVPEPEIVAAALKACRRVNDYSLTTRILEVVHFKSLHNKDIWPYMKQVSSKLMMNDVAQNVIAKFFAGIKAYFGRVGHFLARGAWL